MKLIKKKPQAVVKVRYLYATSADEGQRLDNFLIKTLKGVPKAHLYRVIRKGEVRINKKRTAAHYKLKLKDHIRIPPIATKPTITEAPPSADTIKKLIARIVYEDDNIMVLNKPVGMSVHVGSSVRIGVIEALRYAFPKLKHLELAHRLDSETSGCLVLAKKRSILKEIHELLRAGQVKKIYWALTKGQWKKNELTVNLPLERTYNKNQALNVKVTENGKSALTEFKSLKRYKQASLMEVRLYTGRTHQIRVHAASLGHPIAGDSRYGDPSFNQWVNTCGLKRMFLHAKKIEFTLKSLKQTISVESPLDQELLESLNQFEAF